MQRRAFLALSVALAGLAIPLSPAWASGHGGEKKDTPPPPYITIPAVTATIRKPNGKRGVLSVDCGVEVDDMPLRVRASQSIPRLRAAYASVLMKYASGLAPGAAPNPDFLSRELQRETDRVLGKPGAKFLVSSLLIN